MLAIIKVGISSLGYNRNPKRIAGPIWKGVKGIYSSTSYWKGIEWQSRFCTYPLN
jgi:hypothetical protein